MTTLAEIEAAVDNLPPGEKQELFLYLVALLQAGADTRPMPREFSRDAMERWIADDESGMKRFREGF